MHLHAIVKKLCWKKYSCRRVGLDQCTPGALQSTITTPTTRCILAVGSRRALFIPCGAAARTPLRATFEDPSPDSLSGVCIHMSLVLPSQVLSFHTNIVRMEGRVSPLKKKQTRLWTCKLASKCKVTCHARDVSCHVMSCHATSGLLADLSRWFAHPYLVLEGVQLPLPVLQWS